jgi:hypothetical protein
MRNFAAASLLFVLAAACSSSGGDDSGDDGGGDGDGGGVLTTPGTLIDIDGDGLTDGVGLDTDGDGVIDGIDFDGDGISDQAINPEIITPPATGGAAGTGGGTAGTGGTPAGTGGEGAGAAPATGGSSGITGPLTMGYILDLEQWGGTAALDLLDYSASDYVIHAFYTTDATGAVISVDPIVDSYRTAGLVDKVHNAGKKIVMSLGGANHSYPLKVAAADPGLRATLVANVVAKINEWGYDGVDLDLEFPAGGNEPQDHLALMTDLYNAVKANDPSDLAMFGISPGYYIDQFLWSQLAAVSDYGFYFCYDWKNPANGPMKNPGNNFTALGGAMFEASCSGAMNYMISQGYPADQIVVGLPFYANGGAHYSTIPADVKSAAPDANYMEAPGAAGAWWPNVASTEMKMDAVLDPAQSVLSSGATAAGVGWWEWGYEDPASPDLSAAIKAKLGK